MFESPYIKINEHGIDLIKNYQVERHIDFCEINQIEYKKGHLIHNWGISLIFGLVISITTFIWGVNSVLLLDFHNIPTNHFKTFLSIRLIIPWTMFIAGVILIFLAFQQSSIITIKMRDKKQKIALKEFDKTNNIESLLTFLSARVDLIKTRK